jgi:Icc protein
MEDPKDTKVGLLGPGPTMTGNNGRVLRGIALAVLGLAVCAAALVQAADQKTITLVHLSDVHMRPGFNAPERFRFALRDVRSRKPALIINTGDTVDGSAEADAKWASWHAAVTAEITDIPLYNLLGNHDIDEPLTREIACARLGMPSRYYRFDRFGWRFLMLDGNGFAADKEQWDWLVRELQQAPAKMPKKPAVGSRLLALGAVRHSAFGPEP